MSRKRKAARRRGCSTTRCRTAPSTWAARAAIITACSGGFVADYGDLDYYVIAGPVADIVRRYTWLTGKPALLPRWALGYSGSTMSYTDRPDAQAAMADFLAKCEEHDILCDSFHLSSGYTSIGDKRYVFHWNRDKFPDPAAFVRSYADRGVRLIPNIKPALLADHPLFEEARANGLLVCDDRGEPEWVQFWGAVGAYLDFTHAATILWWREKVTSALLDVGMAGTWNDNNEFEIVSLKATAHGFGTPAPAIATKPLQTLQMIRASRDAQRAHAPGKRPFLVSRSGSAGLQRYAQTWSGDNYTSWETLRYNVKMGLGLALSGISNTGHDVGGFDGRSRMRSSSSAGSASASSCCASRSIPGTPTARRTNPGCIRRSHRRFAT